MRVPPEGIRAEYVNQHGRLVSKDEERALYARYARHCPPGSAFFAVPLPRGWTSRPIERGWRLVGDAQHRPTRTGPVSCRTTRGARPRAPRRQRQRDSRAPPGQLAEDDEPPSSFQRGVA